MIVHDPAVWALVLAASFVGAVIGGVGGFGTGILLTAVLTPLLGVKAVVPVLALAGIIINAGRVVFYRQVIEWAQVRRILPVALPCLFAGTWVYAHLDARPLGVLIGALVLASVPLRRWLKARNRSVGPTGVRVGAGVFGLANGFASGMGVILVSLLMGAGLPGAAVVATDAFITIVLDSARVVFFGKLAVLDAQGAMLGAIIGLVSLPGSALAAWLVRRLDAHLHQRFMEGLILFGGVMILAASLR